MAETSENLLLCSKIRNRNIGLKQAYLLPLPIFFNVFVFEIS